MGKSPWDHKELDLTSNSKQALVREGVYWTPNDHGLSGT